MRIRKHILLRTLRLHLKHCLKKKEEQTFILARLKLSDQQYCLGLSQKLWQLYMDMGSEHHVWPVSYQSVLVDKSNNLIFTALQKYVTAKVTGTDEDRIRMTMEHYLKEIDNVFRQTNEQISTQALTCPSTLSVEPMDKLLKEFVFAHQRRYTRRINCYIAQFKAQLRDHQLWQKLSSYQMNSAQVKYEQISSS